MTAEALAQALRTYAAGLDAETQLLLQLHGIASAQRQPTAQHDVEQLQALTDRREQLLAQLVTLEHDLRPIRESIAANRAAAIRLPGFAALVERHHRAGDMVSAILAADHDTLEALREAEAARRFAARAIEAGENTLAAYRRVVAPAPANASLIDRRG